MAWRCICDILLPLEEESFHNRLRALGNEHSDVSGRATTLLGSYGHEQPLYERLGVSVPLGGDRRVFVLAEHCSWQAVVMLKVCLKR